jgi:predicted acyltransferase
MPGKLYLGIHDPEGLTSTIPAIATGLLGIQAGTLLKSGAGSQQKKALTLLVSGVILVVLAQIWNLDFPINKNLWTSSFALQVGGLSLILLSVFYYIIDVKGYQRWAFFFRVIGMNSILIYMSGHFINWGYMADGFFFWVGQLGRLASEPWGALGMVLCELACKWAFLYFMYRQRIFLRV